MRENTTGAELFDDLSDEFDKGIHMLASKMYDVLWEELEKSIDDIWMDIAKDQEQTITLFFNDAVTGFYSDLPDEEISYKRAGDTRSQSGGLYEALVLPRDEDGLINYDFENHDYSNLFDGTQMAINVHPKRKTIRDERGLRKALFDQAFYEGWHGGAKKIAQSKIEKWGEHPNVGVPHYRKPGLVRSARGGAKWHLFGAWGERAELFYKNMVAYDNSLQMRYQGFADKRANEAVERAAKRLPDVMAEIFG